jgi:transcriptional regulator with XRE-family HTH domain
MKKPDEIADRLRILRREKSQKDFAEELGISYRTYQYYEGGERSPKWAVLEKIAQKCGVTVDWILTGAGAGADRVAESGALYGHDDATDKILDMLKDMDMEARRDVLKYAEKEKLLAELKRERLKKEAG